MLRDEMAAHGADDSALAGGEGARKVGVVLGSDGRRLQHLDVSALERRRGMAKHGAGHGVDVEDDAAAADGDAAEQRVDVSGLAVGAVDAV